MKKIFSMLLVIAMLISMAVVVPFAAEVDGDWITLRQANDYHEVDPETGEEPPYQAAPGYKYTSEGFTTIPADYTGTSPYFNIRSKDKQDIKEGLYLQIRVDDFSYKGPDGTCDEWILFSLWDSENIAPGQNGFGNGWFGLIRGSGGGETATFEGEDIRPELDDQGREIYTFEVEWDGSQYQMTLNGTPIANSKSISNTLEKTNDKGEFYVGISIQSTAKDGVAALSILKFGTSEKTATVPVGSDSAEPEPNNNITAPMMDPATIGENKPGVYFDASIYKNITGNSIEFLALGNNGYHATALDANCFFTWTVRKDVSYAVEDFPVFALMVKDFWRGGTLWYFCGDTVGPASNNRIVFNAFDGVYYQGEFEDYTLILVDIAEMADAPCEGRINGFRIDFNGMDVQNEPEFDILYMGCFRSTEEAEAYSYSYLGLDADDVTTEAPTDAPDDVTDAPDDGDNGDTDDVTNAPDDGNYGGDVTNAPDDGDNSGADGTEKVEGGCGSVLGFSMAGLIALAGAYIFKKKN